MASQLRWTSKSVDLLCRGKVSLASLDTFRLWLQARLCSKDSAKLLTEVRVGMQMHLLCREQQDLEGCGNEGALRQRRV